jgi:hypothetical protein
VLATDWNAIGAGAAVLALLLAIGGGAARVTRTYFGRKREGNDRLDRMEIRLWGLPEDPRTGARKVPGEFDRVYARFDELTTLIKERS